jgi:hypothetical protein
MRNTAVRQQFWWAAVREAIFEFLKESEKATKK